MFNEWEKNRRNKHDKWTKIMIFYSCLHYVNYWCRKRTQYSSSVWLDILKILISKENWILCIMVLYKFMPSCRELLIRKKIWYAILDGYWVSCHSIQKIIQNRNTFRTFHKRFFIINIHFVVFWMQQPRRYSRIETLQIHSTAQRPFIFATKIGDYFVSKHRYT